MSVVVTTLLLALLGVLLPASGAGAVAGGSSIRGTVLAIGGTPLAGVQIDLYERTGPTWTSVAATSTDDEGGYVLADVAPGTYRVGFDDVTGTYQDEYWSNFASIEDALDLVVGAGESIQNISAVLAPPYVPGGIYGAITGRVDGLRPTDAVKVTAFQQVGGSWTAKGFIWTGFDGTYRLNLKAGTYRIGFTEETGKLVPEFWDDVASLDQASDIDVAEDTVTAGHDAVLTPVAAPPTVPGVPLPPAPTPTAGSPVTPAPAALSLTRKPTITGRAVVGKRLRVTRGAWTSSAEVSFTYQWLADGRRIKGATRARLKVTRALLSARLKVRVTARTAGATVAVTTRRTPKVVA